MNIIFLGTPDFSVGVLKAIYNSHHKILAVVTQPDKPVGRKAIITPCACKTEALKLNLKVFSYDNIKKEGVLDLKALNPDIMVTCAYGQILSKEILDIAKYGIINVHASLLPKYRGSSPIQWAIINGEKQTGVTIMQTSLGVDTGDIIMQKPLDILQDEKVDSLFDRLSNLGSKMIVEALNDIENGTATYTKQDESLATHTKMIKKEDGKIDFTKSASEIVNLVRGLYSWPVAYTFLGDKMLKIYSAKEVEQSGACGEVLLADYKQGLVIGAGKNAILIEEVQLQGGKKMPIKDFLLGNKILVGYKF